MMMSSGWSRFATMDATMRLCQPITNDEAVKFAIRASEVESVFEYRPITSASFKGIDIYISTQVYK